MYLEHNGFDHAGARRVVPTLKQFGVLKAEDLAKLTEEELRSSGLDEETQKKLRPLIATVKLKKRVEDSNKKWDMRHTHKSEKEQMMENYVNDLKAFQRKKKRKATKEEEQAILKVHEDKYNETEEKRMEQWYKEKERIEKNIEKKRKEREEAQQSLTRAEKRALHEAEQRARHDRPQRAAKVSLEEFVRVMHHGPDPAPKEKHTGLHALLGRLEALAYI